MELIILLVVVGAIALFVIGIYNGLDRAAQPDRRGARADPGPAEAPA